VRDRWKRSDDSVQASIAEQQLCVERARRTLNAGTAELV